jgi:two-component sensor histidine kinase
MIVNDNIYESSNDNINRVDIPYSMKLFIQELQSMSISAKCVLENHENDTLLLQDIIPKIKNNGAMSYDPESGDGEEEEVEGEEVEADE